MYRIRMCATILTFVPKHARCGHGTASHACDTAPAHCDTRLGLHIWSPVAQRGDWCRCGDRTLQIQASDLDVAALRAAEI
jgi:hypothetical protein